jgi:hypothetical protein
MSLVMIKSDPRAREKPCLRCGYSLRKIESTHCPECGLSVWMSLNQNDMLEWSRPEWLRRMAVGLWIMAGAQVIGLAPYALVTVFAFFPPTKGAAGRWVEVALASVNVLGAAYLISYHAGLFFLTNNERRYPDRLKSWRIASWIIAGIAGLFSLLLLAMAFNPWTFLYVHFALNVVVLASAIVTLGYLRRLAKRIPNSTLARICAWMMLAPVIPFLKVFPFFGFYLIMQFLRLAEFLPVIYLPASALMFIWFAVLFRRAAASADGSWASETAITR